MAANAKPTSKSDPPAHVALLRGINVGGNNKLPMADLSAMFTAAGCSAVATYIQSGNVVFRADATLAASLPGTISQAISKRFGFSAPVVIRSGAEIARASRENPFLEAGADPATLHVAFLAATPTEAAIASLDPNRSPPDRFLVRGNDVYLHMPNGVARSKLTNAWFDARLATVSTLRNWKTVLSLVEMASVGW